MKILLALAAVALAAALVVSATMGAGALVPGGGSAKDQSSSVAPGAKGKARLTAMSFSPLRIKGTGFRPGENVTVKVEDGLAKRSRRVKASSAGAFMAGWNVRYEGCKGMTVSAVGDKGSRAGFQFSEFVCAAPGVGS
jgi:hypothetical protein